MNENIDEFFELFRQYCYLIPFQVKMGIIISHPLIDSTAYVSQKTGEIAQIKDESDFNDVIEERLESLYGVLKIDKNWKSFFFQINRPYRLAILELAKDFITKNNFSEFWGIYWIDTEFPHQNNIQELISNFKYCNKDYLMDSEELNYIKTLPKIITIYRGIQKGASVESLSWTLSYEVALWFSNRFDNNGKVYEAQLNKDDILAYFSGEEEIICEPKNLVNLKEL